MRPVLIALYFFLTSPSIWACVNLGGDYIDPNQTHTGQLDFRLIRQNGCKDISIHKAWYDYAADFYYVEPNATTYHLDGKKYCNAFGFCQSAFADELAMQVKHDSSEFKKEDGSLCVSEEVSFSRDLKKSMVVTRKCKDGTVIQVVYKSR